MEELTISIVDLLGRIGNRTNGLSVAQICADLNDVFTENPVSEEAVRGAIRVEINSPEPRIQEVKKNGRRKRDWYKIRNIQRAVLTIGSPETVSSNYIGAAGECAVMSELLFKGYNVNRMTVDEGIDLVACKDNIFYYIQVKTTRLDKVTNKASIQIKKSSFSNVLHNQVRYVMVVRDETRMMYFVFDQNDIERYMAQGYMLDSDTDISIKICFKADGRPYLYHNGRETDAKWHMDKFSQPGMCL